MAISILNAQTMQHHIQPSDPSQQFAIVPAIESTETWPANNNMILNANKTDIMNTSLSFSSQYDSLFQMMLKFPLNAPNFQAFSLITIVRLKTSGHTQLFKLVYKVCIQCNRRFLRKHAAQINQRLALKILGNSTMTPLSIIYCALSVSSLQLNGML